MNSGSNQKPEKNGTNWTVRVQNCWRLRANRRIAINCRQLTAGRCWLTANYRQLTLIPPHQAPPMGEKKNSNVSFPQHNKTALIG